MLRSRISFAGPVVVAAVALGLGPVPASSQVGGITVPSVKTSLGSTPAIAIGTADTAVAQTPLVPSLPVPTSVDVAPVTVSTEQVAAQTPTGKAPDVQVSALSVTASGAAVTASPPSVAGTAAPSTNPPPRSTAMSNVPTTSDELPGATPAQRLHALRRVVLALQGCLAGLPAQEREVLELRAGVGVDHPRTRKQVARIAHLRSARVRQLERSGLRRLRSLGAGGCETRSPAGTTGLGSLAAAPSGRLQVLAEKLSGAATRAPDASARPSRQPYLAVADGSGGAAPDLAFVLAPIVVLAFLIFAAKEVRRKLNRTF